MRSGPSLGARVLGKPVLRDDVQGFRVLWASHRNPHARSPWSPHNHSLRRSCIAVGATPRRIGVVSVKVQLRLRTMPYPCALIRSCQRIAAGTHALSDCISRPSPLIPPRRMRPCRTQHAHFLSSGAHMQMTWSRHDNYANHQTVDSC